MVVDAAEQIEKFQEFIEQSYQQLLHENISRGLRFLLIDFFELTKYDPQLADQLLEEPEETLKAAEVALEQFDVKGRFRVRFSNLPKSQEIFIRNLRSKHLGKFIAIEGIIKQSSEVRPQAISAKFECPSCGNTITMPQVDQQFREPSRCTCGRKGRFRLLSKHLVDVQRLVLEESPESMSGGAQPKRMAVFLREDLVEPRMEKRTTPGARIIVSGMMYEVPIPTRTGGTSTRFDLAMHANYVETVEEDYSEIVISPEDEKEIRALARDPKIYERLVASVSPSIYGHDKIKEAIMLQLFGGIRKTKKDGTILRGDLHVLLVGDPGCGKTILGQTKLLFSNGKRVSIREYVEKNMTSPCFDKGDFYQKMVSQDIIPSLGMHGKFYDSSVLYLFKKPMEKLNKIKTKTGKELICTDTNPLFVLKNGKVCAIKTQNLSVGDYLACPRGFDVNGSVQKFDLDFEVSTRGKQIQFPEETSPEFWKLMAYWIGEGYCKFGSLIFSNSSSLLLDDFASCLKNVFGLDYNCREKKEENMEYAVHSVNLSRFLHAIDPFFHSLSGEKRVPPLLFQCSKEEISHFLRAYFDGEAHVSDRDIQVSSKSKQLLEDIRHLLLRSGIQSQVSDKIKYASNTKKKTRRIYYELRISGENLEKYLQEISFLEDYKRKALEKIDFTKKRNPNLDIVPGLSSIFKKVRLGLRLTQFDMGVARTTYQHYERGDRNPSRRSLQKIVLALGERVALLDILRRNDFSNLKTVRSLLHMSQNELVSSLSCSQTLVSAYEGGKISSQPKFSLFVEEIQHVIDAIFSDLSLFSSLQDLMKLAYSDIFWDKIVSISPYFSEDEWLYDLEVAKTHNFVANDLFVHNSQILTFVHKAAPKARYVAGRSASGAGLTATVVKDEFLRGWALEAGAMVLADKGVLVLDEMDKISKDDTSALHEAMEQQQISVAKANIQACYSEDTEVLTDKGWKKYSEVKKSKIAQYDPTNNTLQFLSHKGLYVYGYNNKMYSFKNKRIDILVTPNHKMLFKEMRHAKYQALEAENIPYSRFRFLNSGKYQGIERDFFNLSGILHKQKRKHPKYTHQKNVKKIPMDLWLEFLGYFVSEGGVQSEFTFGIPQKHGKNAKKIKNCLQKLSLIVGFTLSETKDGDYVRFQITNTQLISYLKKNCGYKTTNKKLPFDLFFLSQRQLRILYDAMMLGDGSSDGKSYTSTSVELINFFHALACLVGKSASMHVQYDEGYRGNRVKTYRVCLSDRIEPTIKKKQVKKIRYKGKVFCFATKTGFFVTRRNGRIAIQGNTLRTQTSVLAAANPKLGRFDPYIPLPNQIDMPPALINRFDLIFVLRDLPDKELDTKIATRVLESHSYEDPAPEIEQKLLRKYLAYTKQKCFPKLTPEAIEEIKKFYVALRSTGSDGDSAVKAIPISARQLEAIVRLSEACARIKLKKEVAKEDAMRAISLLRYCMNEIGVDPETGKVDLDRMTTGISASARGRIIEVRNIIFALCESKDGPISIEEDVKPQVFDKGITEQKLDEAIEKLKRGGDIFEPKKGWVQKI